MWFHMILLIDFVEAIGSFFVVVKMIKVKLQIILRTKLKFDQS